MYKIHLNKENMTLLETDDSFKRRTAHFWRKVLVCNMFGMHPKEHRLLELNTRW